MGIRKPPRAPSKLIHIDVEYVTLPEEENNERIERLTRKILRLLNGSKELENPSERAGGHPAQGAAPAVEGIEDLLSTNFERRLGI